jgi:hypothetical protein
MIFRIRKLKVTLNSTSLKYDLQNKEIKGNFKFYISQIWSPGKIWQQVSYTNRRILSPSEFLCGFMFSNFALLFSLCFMWFITVTTSWAGTSHHSETYEATLVFSGIHVTLSFVFCAVFCIYFCVLFVYFLLVIALLTILMICLISCKLFFVRANLVACFIYTFFSMQFKQ